MILEIHPKSKKITIEIPDEFVGKDLKVEVKPKSNLDELGGSIKIQKEKINYELESKAWELAVLEKYGGKNDKS